MTFRLSFRQSRVLNCFKRIIVVLGGIHSGKSYTAKMFATEHLIKGENIIFLSNNPCELKEAFSSIGTILRNNRELSKRLSIDFRNHMIQYGDYDIQFTTPPEDIADIVIEMNKYKPCVVVADGILEIPRLLCQISYLENHYGFLFKKVLITGRPSNRIKDIIKSIDNNIEVFTWKYKNKLIKELIK